MTPSSWGYYVAQEPCRASDYYLGHGQDDGRWLGRGLQMLGIEPGTVVQERQLEALFGRALHPETGQRLGRAWRADGVTGYDLTFSSPKSVSALLAAADDWFGPALPGTGRAAASGKPAGSKDIWQQGGLFAAAEPGLTAAVQRSEASRQLLTAAGASSSTQAATPQAGAAAGSGSQVRRAVVAAHDVATRTGLQYLDTHASLSRRGTDGVEQVPSGGLTVAAFTHYTSREGDPQLHTHALVLNKVRCEDGSWRTLDGHEMYAHKKSAGMIYQAVLRNEVAADLGIRFGEVSKDGQAEILGIPEQLLQQWSKRTHAVNLEAASAIAELEAKLGRTLTSDERAAVTKTAVLKTRPDKTHEHPQSLSARWQAEAATLGLDLGDLLPAAQRAALTAGEPARPLSGTELAAAALTAAGRSRAVFSRADVAGQVAALLPTIGMRANEVLATIEQLTDHALELGEAVGLGAPVHGATQRRSDARYATVEILQAEARILTLASTGQRASAGVVGYDQIRTAIGSTRDAGTALDRSQVEAVLHLTSHGDTLDVLTAPAGAGKTATLGTCAAAWHAAGYRVIGLAPSARAAAELGTAITASSGAGNSSGGRVDTLAKWLHTRASHPDLDQQPPDQPGKASWARLDARTVLVVDEASMASTLDLDTLTHAAKAAGAKVVLVGDPAQIGVINGPGGMLATLAADGHALALTSIHRFSQEWEKEASLALREGDRDALQPYLSQQRLHPCLDGDTAADELFAYWQHATLRGVDALMLARTRLDVDALNLRARAAAHAHAAMQGQPAGPVVRLGGRDWQPGDLLRTRKNNRQLPVGHPSEGGHVRNGDRWRVHGPSPDGGLVVEDPTGRGRIVLPAAYVAKHCEYGWAATIDGSQGATCDLGLLLARPGLDREHLYVGMTRGRHGNHAYLTPDPTQGPDQHTPAHPGKPRDEAELQQACLEVLQTALAVSGEQDSATLALRRAQDAEHRQRAPQPREERARPQAHGPAPRAEGQRRPTLTERKLTQAQADLTRLETERDQLRAVREQLWREARELDREFGQLPRWAVTRRHTLTRELDRNSTQQQTVHPRLATLEEQVETNRALVRQLTGQVHDEQQPDRLPPAEQERLAALLARGAQRASRSRAEPAAPNSTPPSVRPARSPVRGLEDDYIRSQDGLTRDHRDRDFGPDLGR